MQADRTMAPNGLQATYPSLPSGGGSAGDEAGFESALIGGGMRPLSLASGSSPGAAAPARSAVDNGSSVQPGATGPSDAPAAPGSSGAAGDLSIPGIDDSTFQSSDPLKKWAPLVQGLPPSQQAAAEKALNRPLAAAQMLKSGDPSQKAAAKAYFDANPSLKAALDTAARGGKSDGIISDGDIDAFTSKMSDQLGRADKTVQSYQKDHPAADAQSLQMVRQTALLQANMPILSGASPDKDGNLGGYVTRDGLQAVAQNNPNLSSALRGAAGTFSQPGMFQALDQGGLTETALATHNPDGKFDEHNIIKWVKKQAPTTGGQFASMISDAATRSAVAGVNTSNLGADVFAKPQNYTGAQKAAVLVQLQTKQEQLSAGKSLRKSDDTNAAIAKHISQLSADPDVKHYLGSSIAGNEKAIIGSDPSLAQAVQNTYASDVVTGQGLQKGLDAVTKNNADKKNTKETDGSAVSDFSAEAQLDSDLSDGKTASAANVIGGNTKLTGELQSDYKQDFSQESELKQLQGQKDADLGTSMKTMEGDEKAFKGVLDPSFVQSQQSSYAQSNSQAAMSDGGSGKAVMDALGSGGKASSSDIAHAISQTNPQQLYGSAQPGLTASDTQSIVNAFLNDLKGGGSVSDASAKFDPGGKSFDPNAADGGVMAKLKSNPAAASNAQALLRNLSASALGMPGSQSTGAGAAAAGAGAAGPGATSMGGTAAQDALVGGGGGAVAATGGGASPVLGNGPVPSGDTPPKSAAEKTQEGLMYSSIGMIGGSVAAAGGNIWNNKRSGVDDSTRETAATKLKLGGDIAGGAGGVLGAAFMLPFASGDLKAGNKLDAGLSIAGGTRGIVQGGALALNAGKSIARYAKDGRFAYTSDGVSRLSSNVVSQAGEGLGRMAASAIGHVGAAAGIEAAGATAAAVGTAIAGAAGGAAEAIAAAAGPVGWAIDAAVGIGFGFEAIANAVKKAHERKDMDKTVDPTLKQYGIPTPH